MTSIATQGSGGPLTVTLSLDTPAGERVRPRDELRGKVVVESSAEWVVEYAELMLFWKTEGRGTENHEIAAVYRVAPKGIRLPAGSEERSFSIQVPDMPWTYHGRLLKIHWTLGVFAKGASGPEAFAEIPLVVHPNPEAFGVRHAFGPA